MTDNSKKVSELPLAANVASTDRVVILHDPSGVKAVRTIPFGTLSANIVLSNTVPLTISSSGIAGTIRYDSDYIYICIANNTWKRSTLAPW
jgi:hypothetical protein